MEMTIDEIIATEQILTEKFQKTVDTHMLSEDLSLEELYCDDTELIEEELKRYQELADFHNQIANTMRKYKKIKHIINDVPYLDKDEYKIASIKEIINGKID